MWRTLVLIASLLAPLQVRQRDGREGESLRSRDGDSFGVPSVGYQGPFFEAFPPDGGGNFTRCQQTAPTGARGETINWTRGSVASCLKSDNFSTGILPGDMIMVPTNVPRVQLADTATGQLGVVTEMNLANLIIHSEELDDVSWVSTAAVTANTTPCPDGGVLMDTLTDSSGAVLQGSTQTATITGAGQTRMYAFSCFVTASTADSATISMTGVTNSDGDCSATFTGLASNSITRIWCGSATTYTGVTAIAAFIGVGNNASVQGDLIVWGCQLERPNSGITLARGYPTSYIPTYSSTVVRFAENFSYSLPPPYNSPATDVPAGCTRACMRPGLWANNDTTTPPGYLVYTGAFGRGARRETTSGTVEGWYDGTNDVAYPTNATQTLTSNTCWTSSFTGSAATLKMNATSSAVAYDGMWGIGVNAVQIGWSTTGGTGTSQPGGVLSQIRFDPQDAGACE